MSHTKEPWKVTDAPRQIVGLNGTVAKLTSLDADNARRIVACVNVCAGIPTDRLEAGAPDIIEFSVDMKKQRDDFLAAVNNMRNVKGRYHTELAYLALVDVAAKIESVDA